MPGRSDTAGGRWAHAGQAWRRSAKQRIGAEACLRIECGENSFAMLRAVTSRERECADVFRVHQNLHYPSGSDYLNQAPTNRKMNPGACEWAPRGRQCVSINGNLAAVGKRFGVPVTASAHEGFVVDDYPAAVG